MSKHNIAIIGGTGPQGKGLGYRFAMHGHGVILASRSVEKANLIAHEITQRVAEVCAAGEVSAASHAHAIAAADVVLIAVPWDGHDELIAALAANGALDGKTVISCVNPLAFDKSGPHGRIIDGGANSAAESAQALAPAANVVGAFHNVSAVLLWGEDRYIDEDVLVVGDNAQAKEIAIALSAAVTGRPGVDAGRLRLARNLEPLTAVLISINRKYKTNAGIRVTGLPV